MVNFTRAHWQAIVWGGIIAGTIDIGAASLINMVDPIIVLRAVASGLLGAESFHMGLQSAALGAGLQIFISVVAAGVYVGAATRFAILTQRPVASGLVFGAIVYFVMNDIVVPLSSARSAPLHWLSFTENMAAMFVFGLLIAFIARYFLALRAQAAV